IGNAIKFTSQGEVSVYVSLEDEDDERAKIRFAVTDTGIGIPKDKIDAIFDSFSQADTSTTRHYGGTGLGLAISKMLAGKMGGEISLVSAEGKGSTFYFTAFFEKRPMGREIVIKPPAEIKDRRILIVDDNAANRRALTGRLNSWQCRCDEASDGESALVKLRAAYAEGDPFQAALLDMRMPGMDGEALGRKIKDDPTISDTPLVMMTSAGKRGDAARLENIGFSAYLTKPVKQSRLYDCLVTILSRKKGSVESRETRIVTRHSIAEDRKHRVRILLAEDNLVNRKVALKILEKFGYRVDAVANGMEAVKALEELPYNLVLMDCQMPEMDGFEATKTIRDAKSAVKNHEVPIIALTAHAMKGDREKCIKAGMDDYISKPFEPRQLIEAIEQALAGRVSLPHDKASETKTQGEEIFDRAGLLDRILGDEELLKEVLEIYLQETPGHIESIKEALKKSDASEVTQHGHKIKGSSGMICAEGMQALGSRVETAGKKDDLTQAASLVEKMEREFAKLKEAISTQRLDQK
ncbi:MAG: response regulator, partial [Thermodesulfobacteriota bacterium]|nr:response regulator [Thermodesulfobacteriota bacterium]